MTAYVVPLLLCAFALYGISQKVPVFDAFMEGAGENAKVILRVLPSLVGLMTAVGMFKASGALDLLQAGLAPVASLLQIPREIIPLALLRPISGRSSFRTCSSPLGRTATSAGWPVCSWAPPRPPFTPWRSTTG